MSNPRQWERATVRSHFPYYDPPMPIHVDRVQVVGPIATKLWEEAIILRYQWLQERAWNYIAVIPGGCHYVTVEQDGDTVFDSREAIRFNSAQYDLLATLMAESGFSDLVINQVSSRTIASESSTSFKQAFGRSKPRKPPVPDNVTAFRPRS